MRPWKKRARGAISIFLVIVLLSNYALISVLVDSGRQKMARATAESALDTAASSVLSYYDQMLYDLYGLFATDSLDATSIQSMLEEYTKKSLGLIPMAESDLTKLTSTVVGSITGLTGEEDEEDGSLFDGYDFQIDSIVVNADDGGFVSGINGQVQTAVNAATSGGVMPQGKSYTLANTSAVEQQIIDHMKYRAPLELVAGAGSFLQKAKSLVEVKDRIQGAMEKTKVTSEGGKAELCECAADLISQIKIYTYELLLFSADPVNKSVGSSLTTTGNPTMAYDVMMLVVEYDKQMKKSEEAYQALINTINEETAYADDDTDEEKAAKDQEREDRTQAAVDELRAAYDAARDDLLKKFQKIASNATKLYTQANTIISEVEQLNTKYNTYIDKLQAKLDAALDANPNDENAKTLYLPEIELAQSSCGEVLKNMDILVSGRQYLTNLTRHMNAKSDAFSAAANKVRDTRMGDIAAGTQSTYVTMWDFVLDGANLYAQNAQSLLDEMQEDLKSLFDYAAGYREQEPVTVKTVSATAPKKETVDKGELRDLKEEDLSISFTAATGTDVEFEIEDDYSEENTSKLLEVGLNIVNMIAGFLEDARDSLYINEYIIMYFPNYVQHYRATDSDLAKDDSNSMLLDDTTYYKPYLASQAELEYVLTGQADVALSVAEVGAQLTAIRTAFNVAAILTDSAKVAQANTLAAAISGPFAPAVAFVILMGWAIAESVIDVTHLMDGEEVAVFKQGADWYFSAEGAIKALVDECADYVGDAIKDKIEEGIDSLASSVETVANKAIYEAFQAIKSGTDSGMSAAQGALDDWTTQMKSNAAGTELEGVADVVTSGLGTLESNVTKQYESIFDSAEDAAITKVNEAVKKTAETIKEKAKSISDDLVEKASELITSSISKYVVTGLVNATGSVSGSSNPAALKMNYLDYMRIFLICRGNTKKVQRLQQLIQANLRYGGREDFSMSGSYINISATMTGSIRFLLMSNALIPTSYSDGRMHFTVSTTLGY